MKISAIGSAFERALSEEIAASELARARSPWRISESSHILTQATQAKCDKGTQATQAKCDKGLDGRDAPGSDP